MVHAPVKKNALSGFRRLGASGGEEGWVAFCLFGLLFHVCCVTLRGARSTKGNASVKRGILAMLYPRVPRCVSPRSGPTMYRNDSNSPIQGGEHTAKQM